MLAANPANHTSAPSKASKPATFKPNAAALRKARAMANGDEPERILQQAFRFHQAQKILKSSPNDQHEALVPPVCVLEAITIELYLTGCANQTRQRLEAMWSVYALQRGEAFKQVELAIEPELTSALAAGRRAFELIRYWHEDPDEDCVFYLGALPNMLFEIAFGLRPDWAKPPNSKNK